VSDHWGVFGPLYGSDSDGVVRARSRGERPVTDPDRRRRTSWLPARGRPGDRIGGEETGELPGPIADAETVVPLTLMEMGERANVQNEISDG
jgi:hypothetical protein